MRVRSGLRRRPIPSLLSHTAKSLPVTDTPLPFRTFRVVSQNSTGPTTRGNSTSNPNATTMATDTFSSSANSTSPTGASVSLHAGTVSLLLPVAVAASLLQRYC
ncbi:hypothetical protein L3Q82_011041 [Scortum barcoo]|uniref:Uncharacterized protein n=1 Tax=Scortum barcoo TaxID=214431 RepID=A0ACB8W992_9TELE|nr:hypothetical protein L3Q82_011041 [Scortum barcoo]